VSPALPQGLQVDTLTWQKINTLAIPAGTYIFTCTAQNRCGDVFEKSISLIIRPKPVRPVISVAQKPIPCRGDSVVLRISNPETGTRYRWNTGDSTQTLIIRQTGLYAIVSASNEYGCTDPGSDTVAIAFRNAPVPAVPILQSPLSQQVCVGQQVWLKATSPGQVVWSNGTASDSTQTRAPAKLWAITRTSEGCTSSATDTLSLTLAPTPRLSLQAENNLFCEEKAVIHSIQISGTDVFNLETSVLGGEIIAQSNAEIVVNWLAGQNLNRSLQVVPFSALGCQGTAEIYRPLLAAKPEITLLAIDSLYCTGQNEEQRITVSSTATDSLGIALTGGELLSSSPTEIMLRWLSAPGLKRITVQPFSHLGCAGEAVDFSPSVDLAACRAQFPLLIPNVVTPNADGKNDQLKLGNISYHQPVKLRLANRWGSTIFQTDNYQNTWPEGEIAPGTYFLWLESFGKVWKGMVEVLR